MVTPTCPPQSILIIELDVFHLGWGAQCIDASTGGCLSVKEAKQYMNYLELLAEHLPAHLNSQKNPE